MDKKPALHELGQGSWAPAAQARALKLGKAEAYLHGGAGALRETVKMLFTEPPSRI